jgi:hypothetical protein
MNGGPKMGQKQWPIDVNSIAEICVFFVLNDFSSVQMVNDSFLVAIMQGHTKRWFFPF